MRRRVVSILAFFLVLSISSCDRAITAPVAPAPELEAVALDDVADRLLPALQNTELRETLRSLLSDPPAAHRPARRALLQARALLAGELARDPAPEDAADLEAISLTLDLLLHGPRPEVNR